MTIVNQMTTYGTYRDIIVSFLFAFALRYVSLVGTQGYKVSSRLNGKTSMPSHCPQAVARRIFTVEASLVSLPRVKQIPCKPAII